MFNLNFFRKKAAEADSHRSTAAVPVPPLEMFVADTPPSSERQISPAEARPTKLAAFLGRDYWGMGRRDGYLSHTAESLEMWRRKTKSEFQLVMDQLIQDRSEQRLTLLNHLAGIGTIHAATSAQLKNTLQELEAEMERLTTQKELSALEEGWIMNVLHSYQLGFTQGLQEYIESENLVKGNSLF